MSDAEKRTSVVYNETLVLGQMQDRVTVRLDAPHGSRIFWTLGDPTGRDGWSFAQTGFTERLLPHLRQYIRVRQALADSANLQIFDMGLA